MVLVVRWRFAGSSFVGPSPSEGARYDSTFDEIQNAFFHAQVRSPDTSMTFSVLRL